jgi:hypothetical protein
MIKKTVWLTIRQMPYCAYGDMLQYALPKLWRSWEMKLATNRLAARDGLPAKPEAQLLASEDTHL